MHPKRTESQRLQKEKEEALAKAAAKKKQAHQQATSTGSKPKGIGYGDITNANLVLTKEKSKEKKKAGLNAFESDQVFGNLANNERWAILEILIKCLTNQIKLIKNEVNIETHKIVQFSVIPSLIHSMFKNYNISEILSSEKLPAFTQLLDLLEEFGSIAEFGDMMVDLEYGGKDNENAIYDLVSSVYGQGKFYTETLSTKKIEVAVKQDKTEKQIAEEKIKIDEENQKVLQAFNFIDRLEKVYKKIEHRLEQGQYLNISYVEESKSGSNESSDLNLEQFYQTIMKPLILGSCSILEEKGYQAQMASYVGSSAASPPQTKMTRIVHELSDIANSLPCEGTNSIFLRYDTTRMDVMRTIIFGASGTPYAHGAFLYNFFFCDDYPQRPPKCLLETTGHGKVRFNPNLYNCGKVCLSLLGTWGDNWIPNVSTLLQILISIQAMVMSEYVYFNEPGWEHSMGTPEGDARNRGYCNIVKLANIRYAMIEAIREPYKGFEDVILKSFYLRKDLILKEVKSWIAEADLLTDYSGTQNSNISNPFQQDSSRYKVVLKSEISELEKELDKLKLKLQGTLSLGPKQEKKKIIKVNHGRPSLLYSKKIREIARQKKKQEIESLYQTPLQQIDVEYESKTVSKSFNINSTEVQSLLSRYIGVMGIEAVAKQSQASVFLYGLSPLGLEVAKNLILSGLKRLTIADIKRSQYSLTGQFYMKKNTERLEQNLQKLSHLNPFVQIDTIPNDQTAKEALKHHMSAFHISNYNVVVVCEYEGYHDLLDIATTCRGGNAGLILGDQLSVYGRVIVDLGDQFQVFDKDGEPPLELKVESIIDGVVQLPKGQKHSLQDGDIVTFKEVIHEQCEGEELNGAELKIKVINKSSFQLEGIDQFKKWQRNGIAVQVKQKAQLTFKPLRANLQSDAVYDQNMGLIFDEAGIVRRNLVQILFEGYWIFYDKKKIHPTKFEEKLELYEFLLQQKELWDKLGDYQNLWKYSKEQTLAFCLTVNGCFPPLSAYLGGVVSQEVIKAITKKYMPINSVYIHSCEEVLCFEYDKLAEGDVQNYFNQLVKPDDKSKYNELKTILGDKVTNDLMNLKLFMIGAGAIGCELLKNYALLGIGSGDKGRIILTDPDVIEHSNLSRQFLFREKHIRKPKSATAACAALQMNQDLKITARMDKIYPGTESTYSNYFFQQLGIVTNALDNVQARLYVDQRCVANSKPLIESGTLGAKGHVQVILPGLTESYGSKQDPQEDNEIPYCTLKMFPEDSLHCLEWARDKFEKMFFSKPTTFKNVLENLCHPESLQVSSIEAALKFLQRRPKNFIDCLQYARDKYQKFFDIAIVQLLEAYPLDHKDDKGKLFWSSPKRPPTVNKFDSKDENKLKFIKATAILYASLNKIQIEKDLIENNEKLVEVVEKLKVKEYQVDKSKVEEIQKQVKQQQQQQIQQQQMQEEISQEAALEQSSPNELILQILSNLTEYFTFNEDPEKLEIKQKKPLDDLILVEPIVFEKDADENEHINFIQGGTNCRAGNYNLEGMDWLQVKLKAGRIVPAMATTTSCIAGLQTIEVVKVIKGSKLCEQKNSFLNLSIPYLMQPEPGECESQRIREDLNISFWTKWIVHLENENESLGDFMKNLEKEKKLLVVGVNQGAKAIYLPLMFVGKDQQERGSYLDKALLSYLEFAEWDEYAELDITVEDDKQKCYNVKVHVML